MRGGVGVTAALMFVVFVLVVTAATGALVGSSSPSTDGALRISAMPSSAPLAASLSISPDQVQEGSSVQVQTTANGGDPPYSYSYNGLPQGCSGEDSPSFSCNPSESGTYSVTASVVDSNGTNAMSNLVGITVTSENNGNGNGNNNGSNSSNPLSGLLSDFGGVLTYVVIVGIVGFATWILLIVGVWVIAVVLMRRLPKPGASPAPSATVPCASCAKSIPAGTKFCPECGASTAVKSS